MAHGLPDATSDTQRSGVVAGDTAGAAAGSAVRNAPSTISNMFSGIGDFFSNLFSGASSTAAGAGGEDEDTDPATPGVQRRRGSFRWGETIGGLLGVGGAWLLSSIFGGGWLGTIMFALFAIPGFMMGRSQLGGTMSGLFGEEPRTPAQPAAGAAGQAQNQTLGQPTTATPDQPVTPPEPQLTPQQTLLAEVAEVGQKSQIARQTVILQAQNGQIQPRRAQSMLRQIGRAEEMVQQMGSLDVNQLSPEHMRRIYREFGQAENYLDRTIGSNAIVAAQIQQRVAAPQPGTGVRPMAANLQTSIGVMLPPQAERVVNEVRSGAPNYAYGQAHDIPTASQQFNGSQYLAPQRIN